jgi:phosphomannomutase
LTGAKLQEAKSVGIIKRDKTMEFFKDLSEQVAGGASLEKICDEINSRVSDKSFTFTTPKNICFVGDGTYLEFDNFWCLIRASGTDALLRYYIEGQNKEELDSFKKILIDLQI